MVQLHDMVFAQWLHRRGKGSAKAGQTEIDKVRKSYTLDTPEADGALCMGQEILSMYTQNWTPLSPVALMAL